MLFPRFVHVEVLEIFPVENADFSDFSFRVEFNGFQVDVILGVVAVDRRFNTVRK